MFSTHISAPSGVVGEVGLLRGRSVVVQSLVKLPGRDAALVLGACHLLSQDDLEAILIERNPTRVTVTLNVSDS